MQAAWLCIGMDALPLHFLARRPDIFLQVFSPPDRQTYLSSLLSPLAWLPLLGFPELLAAAPALAGNLLSNSVNQRLLVYQYSLAIGPVLFFALIEAVRRLRFLTEAGLRRQSPSWATTVVAGKCNRAIHKV
jgi:uncharacterized membrane protein